MRWHLLVRDENGWNNPSVTSVGTQVHLSGSVKMSKAVSSRKSLRGGVSDRHSSSGSVAWLGNLSSRDFASDGHRRGFLDANHWTYVSRVKWEELLSWHSAADCVIRFITLSSRNPFAFRDPQSSDHGEFSDSDDDFCTKMNFGRLPALPVVTLRKACCDRYLAMTLGAATKSHTPFRTEQFPVCSEFLPAFEFER